jgi:hypothetical protein
LQVNNAIENFFIFFTYTIEINGLLIWIERDLMIITSFIISVYKSKNRKGI